MNPREFITFAESIRAADDTGNAGKAQTFFSAVLVGYYGTSHGPPPDDKVARDGFSLGVEIRKSFK